MATETITKSEMATTAATWFPLPEGNPTVRRVKHNEVDAKEIVRIIHEDGAVVIEGLLTPDQVARYNAEIAPALGEMHPGSFKTFREEIIDSDTIHAVCDELFRNTGNYWLSTSQVMSIGPGSPRQPLHRDQNNWFPAQAMGPGAPESAIAFLLAQDDTTEENGATLAIPKSNLWPFNLEDGKLGSYEQCSIVELKAGDALAIGGKIVHGGGANRTKDFWRKVTTIMFCNSAFAQEEAFQIFLDRELVKQLPERVKKVLGFRTLYPMNSPGLNTLNNDEISTFLGW
ncbi:hypothetical protein BGZ61DRAFT_491566 [Ilyonectria robusta]|uniref:uncharacterized protein n=1 Tax=Ilyonectria robusta TaxID=1079257 RepID=UPI001E8DC654|nr:uncharacterized protein BGZ61DRAFT_491566 [Ilyonectria robusta]KAH8734150.1 hypothetical protein BGZ61DRAFT_491566 [Ilyonectria robusta]